MKVLLIGHACCPELGSEPGNTWNWAWQLSKHHEVWLLAHPQHRDRAEQFLEQNPNSSLHLVWIAIPQAFDPWRPDKGEKWLRLHYVLWLRRAFRVARRMHDGVNFDVCHHVSLGTISAPPPFWKLPVPSVWGPFGGGQCAPVAFRAFFGSGWWKQQLRDLRVRVLPLLPSLGKAARSARICLVANRETRTLVLRSGARDARLFLDCGLNVKEAGERPRNDSGTLTLLWAGRLEPRKALPLALAALKRSGEESIRILVAGEGPLRQEWEQQSRALNLQNQVTFCGLLSREGMAHVFRTCDGFLFTSLCDSFGSVVLEAMSQGLPVLTLDHQGVGAFVSESAGFKVPVTNPEETVSRLAQALRDFAGLSEQERRQMGTVARQYARTQTWELRAKEVTAMYQEIVENNFAEPDLSLGLTTGKALIG